MVDKTNSDKLAFTVEEVADALNIGRNLAYEAIRNGDIPSVRIGKRILIPKVALENLLSGQVLVTP